MSIVYIRGSTYIPFIVAIFDKTTHKVSGWGRDSQTGKPSHIAM